MACPNNNHNFQPTTVTKGGKQIIVMMCTRCGWIENSVN